MHRKKLTRWFGLSLLAAVAVMAMHASAAQAKYLLDGGTTLKDGSLLLQLNLSLLLSEFLLEVLGTHFHCPGGAGSLALQTNSSMTTLSGSGTLVIKECKVNLYACTVKTPGSAPGELVVSLSGEATMSGSTTSINIASSELVAWEYNGALCPFDELVGMVNGEVTLALPNGETLNESKSGTLDDVPGKLFYGEEELTLHGTNLTTPVAFHATKEGGGTWAVQLTGL